MVKRILLISNFGPLYPANIIYKYLMAANIECYTVGRIYDINNPVYAKHQKRCGYNHLPLFWEWKMANDGSHGRMSVDIASIFNILGDGENWDAIIEFDSRNILLEDNFNLIDQFYNIPYYYYKTSGLFDYVNQYAEKVFYTCDFVKERILKANDWLDEKNLIKLPFTADPEFFKLHDSPEHDFDQDLYFAGQVPNERSDQIFKDVYKKRKEILEYVKSKMNGRFKLLKKREKQLLFYGNDLIYSKVCINAGAGSLNMRDFEVIASGRPLLSLYNPEYEKNGFINDVNCVLFSTKEEAFEKAKFLLDHPYIREEIAKKGYELFMEKHAPVNRVKTILEEIYA